MRDFEQTGDVEWSARTYLYVGEARRELHNLGSKNLDFYREAHKGMGYDRNQSWADIGAGMGKDALIVAKTFPSRVPRVIHLLEPEFGDPKEFDDRFFRLAHDIEENRLTNLVLLPSFVSRDRSQIVIPSGVPEANVSYLNPLPGVAEELPFPSRSIQRLTAIHSAYEWYDLPRGIGQMSRVLAEDGLGAAIVNGPNDKLVFKEMLHEGATELGHPELTTVSAGLNYQQLFDMLTQHFERVLLYAYQDDMLITPGRPRELYEFAWESYRAYMLEAVAHGGRWRRVTKDVVQKRIDEEMAANNRVLVDSIDTAVIYFAHSDKAVSHLLEGEVLSPHLRLIAVK
jgi:ubiquinone/menaquinone biosynthesis C-methylase UbiE